MQQQQFPSSSSTPNQQKHISFQTEQSLLSQSTHKKYLLKNRRLPQQILTTISPKKQNIFDLTSQISHPYSQIETTPNNTESRLYTNSLFSSPSKETILDNRENWENPEKKVVLPIVTESKYNFKPIVMLPKIRKNLVHEKEPFYVKSSVDCEKKNIRKLKKYQMLWARSAELRQDKSLIDRSEEKADKIIQKHNYDLKNKKSSIQFETILRDRHIKQENRIGMSKGVPNRSLTGLKGKGGSVRSLFQQMYAVQQVYKIDR